MVAEEIDIGFFEPPTTLDGFFLTQGMALEIDDGELVMYTHEECSAQALYFRSIKQPSFLSRHKGDEPDWSRAPNKVVSTVVLRAEQEDSFVIRGLRDSILRQYAACIYNPKDDQFYTNSTSSGR
jgi:hypothetical protein